MGLLRRECEVKLLAPINVKRVYLFMRDHDLLLEQCIKQSGVQRRAGLGGVAMRCLLHNFSYGT